MVRRFVQQEQVGLLQQQPAESDATPFAARERGDVGVPWREAQRVHGDLESAVELPGASRVDRVLNLRLLLEQAVHLVVFQRLGEAGADVFELLQQCADLRHALLDVSEHILGGVELRLLGQVADADPLADLGLPQDLRVVARHDAEQRALTCPVVPEHADLGGWQEGQRDPLEQHAIRRNDLAEVLHGVDEFGHGWRC